MRYFVALAETLHFGRAAQRLGLSQPPLSRQIAALEKDLGARLIERHSRQAALTPAGKRFLEDSRAVISAFDQACRNARLTEQGEFGELSIGFMMHAANTVVPGLARRYMAARPLVHLTLREAMPSALPDDVLAGRFDAGIMFPQPARSGLATSVIHRESLCLAVHRSHRLAEQPVVAARDLADARFIATPVEVAPTLRNAIVDYCRSADFAPVITLEAQLQQTIVQLVAENLGVALLPTSMRKSGVADVCFLELEAAPVIEHVIGWRRDNSNPALPPLLDIADVPEV